MPGGELTDECSFLVGDPFGDELLDATVGREDADRTVSSPSDRPRAPRCVAEQPPAIARRRAPAQLLDEELGTISALDPVRHVRSLAFDVSPGTVVLADGPIIEGPWPSSTACDRGRLGAIENER